jgi:hypothetical protein
VDFFNYKEIAQTVIEVLSQPEAFTNIKTQARQTIIDRCDLKTVCLPEQISFLVDADLHTSTNRHFSI